MRLNVLVVVILLLSATSAGAIVDLSIGAYGGMDIPVVNDEIKNGPLFGLQGRVGFLSFLAAGAYYRSSSYGDMDGTFFEGDPDEFTSSISGGNANSFGVDAYFGRVSGTSGLNFYLYGSISSYRWSRDDREDISKAAYGVGLGAEVVLPFKLGIEGRGVFRVVPTDNSGSLKSVLWFIGANYHFGLSK
ncbi:MAG: hypothetical protein P8181_14050 [bacterium]